MEQLLADFLQLPGTTIYAIFGGVGGLIGALLGALVKKVFNAPLAGRLVLVAVIAAAVTAPRLVLPTLEARAGHIIVIKRLKDVRLFNLIFKLHPEAEAEMSASLKDIVAHAPRGQLTIYAQAASGEIVGKYLEKYLPNASVAATHALILRERNVLQQFQSNPQLCVGYHLGRLTATPEIMSADFLAAESDTKADAIESALKEPSAPPSVADPGAIFREIAEGYVQKGYDMRELAQLDKVGNLSPAEGCAIATHFVDVLASMPPAQAAALFKGLIVLSAQP